MSFSCMRSVQRSSPASRRPAPAKSSPANRSNGKPEDRSEPAPGRLLTADEVASRLGVPRSWVYAQARQNKIPFVPLGHYRRFRPEAIDRWLQEMESGQSVPLGAASRRG